MANAVGFVGTIRGRMGNIVFSRGIDGRTVMRAYQPQVSNPRTSAQRMQRAKVNVAGQFSGMVGKDVIAPLGMGSVRANRSEFIKKLLRITTASMSGNDATAQFPAAAVQFSNGNTPMCATMGPQAVTANSVKIPLTLTDAEKAGRYGEKLIVVVMNVAGNLPGGKVREVVSKDVVLTSTTAQSVTLGFSAPLTQDQRIHIYRVPFLLDDSRVGVVAGAIYDDNSDITAILASNPGIVSEWGKTFYGGVSPFSVA